MRFKLERIGAHLSQWFLLAWVVHCVWVAAFFPTISRFQHINWITGCVVWFHVLFFRRRKCDSNEEGLTMTDFKLSKVVSLAARQQRVTRKIIKNLKWCHRHSTSLARASTFRMAIWYVERSTLWIELGMRKERERKKERKTYSSCGSLKLFPFV